ncbi:MAG: YceI family protein [Chloroflexi bacterium]|nr:YceI family protein [Chloroflexota bacterium]
MVTYQIDPMHSQVEFGVKHMMFTTVKGRFGKVSGQIQVDEADPTSSTVTATAEAGSVDTGDAQRDGHLRSPDFFDAEQYPLIQFSSKRIQATGSDGRYKLVGDLTIRDVTREVALEASFLGEGRDPWGGVRAGFNATGAVNRKDFGLQWNVPLEAGGFLVGDTVTINLEVEAVKQSEVVAG